MSQSRKPLRLAVQVLALAAVVVALGVAPGEQRALLLFGATTTFWQPVQTLVGGYGAGERWAKRSARPVVVIVVTTLGIMAGAVALTVAAQSIVGNVGLSGLVSTSSPISGRQGALPTFPWLIPLGALLFVAFLQITMTCEGEPFVRLPRPWGGCAALVSVSALSVGAYFLLVNWDSAPPGLPGAIGLVEPRGPVPASDLPAFLVVVAAWQVISLNLLGGWPGTRMGSRAMRIAVNNAVVLGAGTGTYVLLHGAGIALSAIAAIGGCTVAGSRLVAVLALDGRAPRSARQRLRLVGLGATSSAALWLILTAVVSGAHFSSQPPGLWITVMALNVVSGGIGYLTDILPRARAASSPKAPAAQSEPAVELIPRP